MINAVQCKEETTKDKKDLVVGKELLEMIKHEFFTFFISLRHQIHLYQKANSVYP